MFYDDSNLTPDLEWMLQSNQGSQLMVIEAVVREYAQPIYRLALWLLNDPAAAEEAFQETLIAVPANRHRFSEKIGVRNWLLALTIGVCRRYRCSRLNRPVRALLRALSGQTPVGRRVRRAIRKETEVDRQLWLSIDSLGERQRIPLLLKTVLGLSAPEIARIVGVRESAARSSLRSASRKLFSRLRKRICQLRVSEQMNWLRTLSLRHRRARRLIEARIEAGSLNAEDQRRLDVHLQGCAACRGYVLEMVELDGLVQNSLPARWTQDDQPDLGFEAVLARVEACLGEQRKQGALLHFIRQAAVGGAAIALVLAISWITNLLFPRSAAPLQRTAAGTQLVSVPVTQDVTPAPPAAATLQPLTEQSTPEEVLRLMMESDSLWNSIWVDAQVTRYGPAGYIGPPQAYRSQIWVEQPDKKMVLSGPLAKEPEYVSFLLAESIYEMDINNDLTYYARAGETDTGSLPSGERPAFLGMYGYNTRGILDGSLVFKLLFPGRSIAAADGLHQHGLEDILGRKALIVDMRLEGDRHRLWVDTETGMVLRWHRFDPEAARQVIEEVLITDLSFEAVFPEQSYSSYIFSSDRFIWENEWRPDRSSAVTPTPASAQQPYGRDRWLEPLNGVRSYRVAEATPTASSSFPFDPPEYGFDLARSRLTFQWRPALEPGAVYGEAQPGELADIFADGRLIGQASMGNPWNLFCERSPDGNLIAFLDPPLGPEGLYIAHEGPYWFNLADPYQVTNALPNGVVVSSDFAFSPDSQKLAFWGCGGSEQNCGIFLQDTQSGKNLKLLELSQAATFFTWSPDGKYLVFVTADNRLMVVRVRNGEIIYQSEPDEDALDASTHLESIRPAWSLTFPSLRTGLEGCVEPPESAGNR